MKKKKFAEKIKEVIKPKNIPLREVKCFETTDKTIVDRLQEKGFTLKTVISPSGDRLDKLFVFNETEEQVKEVLNA